MSDVKKPTQNKLIKGNLKKRLPNRGENDFAINNDGYLETEDAQDNELIDERGGSSDELIITKKKVRIVFPSHHLMPQFPLRY